MVPEWLGLKITCVILLGLCISQVLTEENESEIGEEIVVVSLKEKKFYQDNGQFHFSHHGGLQCLESNPGH